MCKFYDEIDAILGSRPATRPSVVIESLNDGEQSSSESGSDEDSENVSFRNENEELERPVNDNQSGASVDDESASVSAERTETEQSEQPLAKKRKVTRRRLTTAEKVVTDVMSTFVKFQQESEERMIKYEDRRAQEERAHEERLLRLMLGARSPGQQPSYFPPQPSQLYYNTASYNPEFETNDGNYHN